MNNIVKTFSICLLLFKFGLCSDLKSSLEAFIKKTIQEDVRLPSMLKRMKNAGYSNEDYSANDNSAMEIEHTHETTTSDFTPTRVIRRKLSKFTTKPSKSHNCNCKRKDGYESDIFKRSTSDENAKDNTDDDGLREPSYDTTTIHGMEEEMTTLNPTTYDDLPSDRLENELNEKHLEVNETDTNESFDVSELCPHFKEIPDLDFDKAVGVWQLIQYRSHVMLSCFEIIINKTTPEIQKYYEHKYTNFNDTINWNECHLEITSTEKLQETKKHFLLGNTNNKGVLENIVLTEISDNNSKTVTLLEQAPDQWFLRKDLLLMRDCDNSDVVIFRRASTTPNSIEIEDAMYYFGEDNLTGVLPCANRIEEPTINERFHILS